MICWRRTPGKGGCPAAIRVQSWPLRRRGVWAERGRNRNNAAHDTRTQCPHLGCEEGLQTNSAQQQRAHNKCTTEAHNKWYHGKSTQQTHTNQACGTMKTQPQKRSHQSAAAEVRHSNQSSRRTHTDQAGFNTETWRGGGAARGIAG